MLFNGKVLHEFPILPFAPGDEVELRMPGGAGFGNVSERSREAVERDVSAGYVTAEAAAETYGVELEPRAVGGGVR